MRRWVSTLCLLIATLASAQTAPPEYSVEKLADGVYALIRQDPVGWMVVSNCVFIINDRDVIVVDTGGATSLARQMIAELRKLTDKPVRYVINTHWHDDHILGNAAYREAFPQAEFIAHANLREYLKTRGDAARRTMEEGAPGFVKLLHDHIEKNESLAGGAMGAEERTAYTSDIRLVNRYLEEVKSTPIILPDVTFQDRLTVSRGDREIDVLYLGRAHTSGDVVVYLPKEGIVIAGDIVITPIPLVGSDQSHVADWSATLDKLRALKATTIVPGHGPVMHDDKQLEVLSRMFRSITEQTQAGISKGESLDQIRKSIDLTEFKQTLAGDSTVRQILFSSYVVQPGTASAYSDLTAKPQSSER